MLFFSLICELTNFVSICTSPRGHKLVKVRARFERLTFFTRACAPHCLNFLSKRNRAGTGLSGTAMGSHVGTRGSIPALQNRKNKKLVCFGISVSLTTQVSPSEMLDWEVTSTGYSWFGNIYLHHRSKSFNF
jgi:hypothetical protein